MLKKTESNDIEKYISQFPDDTQEILRNIRKLILEEAPEAEEKISYGMPGYKLNGKPLVYFAGYKNHIGFYATPEIHGALQQELSKYKQGKGSVQFPLNEEIPYHIIRKMTSLKVELNMKK